jgi:DNA-binding NarL/FixJ family response regulator
MGVPRIIVIEDDAFTRTSIAGALSGIGIEVVASVGTSAEAVIAFEQSNPDAVLIDLDLGYGPTGLDLARSFRLRKPTIGLVLLTTYSDPRLLRSKLPDIPVGTEYLIKSNVSEIKIVKEAIFQAIANAAAAKFSNKLSTNDIPKDFQTLTNIQVETLRMVAQGNTNSEIAKLRFVSEKAVEQTISKIAKALEIPAATNQNQRVHIARVYFRLTGKGNIQ